MRRLPREDCGRLFVGVSVGMAAVYVYYGEHVVAVAPRWCIVHGSQVVK